MIGIIALLVSILLPTLSRAREQAAGVACMSNLRQIAIGLGMYADQNRERYPAPAWIGDPKPDDWIYWQQNLEQSQSPIAPYLGGFNARLLRCPSDDISTHKQTNGSAIDPVDHYLYSYTVNESICNRFNRLNNKPVVTRAMIRNPTGKILVIDEAYTTIDDGCWWSSGVVTQKGSANALSIRHDKKAETNLDLNAGRGNAAFVDGHVEFIPRLDSTLPVFYDPLVN